MIYQSYHVKIISGIYFILAPEYLIEKTIVLLVDALGPIHPVIYPTILTSPVVSLPKSRTSPLSVFTTNMYLGTQYLHTTPWRMGHACIQRTYAHRTPSIYVVSELLATQTNIPTISDSDHFPMCRPPHGTGWLAGTCLIGVSGKVGQAGERTAYLQRCRSGRTSEDLSETRQMSAPNDKAGRSPDLWMQNPCLLYAGPAAPAYDERNNTYSNHATDIGDEETPSF
ncbi:hypothetical protein ACRALDRAFT_210576 [Sodiomyces alcalophilus JCM 7366]|uniref:uncharacterized protein n=1 Tax=Sodiomyces alcalophilus JCM 7366 TaxID=591952 RepID=UPI0039B683DC